MLHRCGMLNRNSAVSFSAACAVVVLRQVRKAASCLPCASKGRYPCIIAEMPMAPTVSSFCPNFSSTSLASAANAARTPAQASAMS